MEVKPSFASLEAETLRMRTKSPEWIKNGQGSEQANNNSTGPVIDVVCFLGFHRIGHEPPAHSVSSSSSPPKFPDEFVSGLTFLRIWLYFSSVIGSYGAC